MDVDIENSWKKILCDEFDKPYFTKLTEFVRNEYTTHTAYPHPRDIFNAFKHTPFKDVRVVIVGQDPYHGPRQAIGLSFAVPEDVDVPPSLRNIYKEIEAEYDTEIIHKTGDLTYLAKQGVLLLNATLTVRAGEAGSHQNKGWEEFTDAVLHAINSKHEHVVFLLWGSYARKKGAFIDRSKHLVLESPHPSPLSAHRGFLGNGHFKKANEYLEEHGKTQIKWIPPEK